MLVTVLAMVGFGLLMVYSSSFIYSQERMGDGYALIRKQVLFAALGIAALAAASRVSYRRWFDWGFPILCGATLLLIAVRIPGIGMTAGGAQRWLKLGSFGGFQPGELVKVAIVIFVARQLERKGNRLNRFVPGVMAPVLAAVPALCLLLVQPDFGSVAVTAVVVLGLMFLAGVPKRTLAAALAVAMVVGGLLAAGTPYRRARLMAFIDPWSDPAGKGFQVLQSFVGLHNGGIFGVGLGNGKEKLLYLPEAHNDFIFSVIGEELGFIGVMGVILAFCYFTYRGFRIARECHERHGDAFGALLAAGITLLIASQGFVNMAVALGLVPTKGLTLPFISYGGSAIVVDLFAVGLLLSVARGPRRPEAAAKAEHG